MTPDMKNGKPITPVQDALDAKDARIKKLEERAGKVLRHHDWLYGDDPVGCRCVYCKNGGMRDLRVVLAGEEG